MLLEGYSPGCASIRTVLRLRRNERTSDGVVNAVGIGFRGKPFCVERETQKDFLRCKSEAEIFVDSLKRALNTTMVLGPIVTTIHQVIGHHLFVCMISLILA